MVDCERSRARTGLVLRRPTTYGDRLATHASLAAPGGSWPPSGAADRGVDNEIIIPPASPREFEVTPRLRGYELERGPSASAVRAVPLDSQ